MTLNERLANDMKEAMKAQNTGLLSTLRMLRSALQNQAIALGHELNDIEVMATLEKQAKQRRDSIDQYIKGNREDLAEIETSELTVIQTYLPKKLDQNSLEALIDEAIAETGASTIADMGKVIKLTQEKAAGAADGKQTSELVRGKLS